MKRRLNALLKQNQEPQGVLFNNGHSGLNILALMFREVRLNLALPSSTWGNLVKRYVRDPRVAIDNDPKTRSSEASNLNRALGAPDLTYNNFIKALKVISPDSAKFTLFLQLDGRTFETEVVRTQDELFQDEPTNVLKLWYLDILNGLYTSQNEFNQIIKSHFKDNEPDDQVQESHSVYLIRTLNEPRISIKVFTRILSIIDPIYIRFRLDLYFSKKIHTVHEVTMRG